MQPFYVSTFTLPIFPLPEVFLFPGTFLPLHIFEPRYRLMLDFCLENGNEMAIAPYKKDWNYLESSSPPIESVFGWGHVIQKEGLPDGRSNIILEGMGTAKLVSYESTEPFRIAQVEKIQQELNRKDDPDFQNLVEELLVLTKRILLSEGAEENLIMKMNHITKHPFPIDFIASLLNYEFSAKQDILATANIIEKANKLIQIVRSLNMRE
ncbi:LON peptidase substrate-binding domain-containing protein [Leptospira ilyithenensis]|uniref:LON peptidase substrate-binding domain-containing protein n=1 Tax=Leptospira ilyithenensis TaxID=2484901 RepID=UPI001438328F|nr:LON peptidase substrate-binding domain-containing protein [Leptospira ilyithenensis]